MRFDGQDFIFEFGFDFWLLTIIWLNVYGVLTVFLEESAFKFYEL